MTPLFAEVKHSCLVKVSQRFWSDQLKAANARNLRQSIVPTLGISSPMTQQAQSWKCLLHKSRTFRQCAFSLSLPCYFKYFPLLQLCFTSVVGCFLVCGGSSSWHFSTRKPDLCLPYGVAFLFEVLAFINFSVICGRHLCCVVLRHFLLGQISLYFVVQWWQENEQASEELSWSHEHRQCLWCWCPEVRLNAFTQLLLPFD